MENPNVPYIAADRFSKTFEAILGPGMIKDGHFRLTDAARLAGGFAANESVPEGTCVKLSATAGELTICAVEDADVYGITLQRIDPISTTHPYLRKEFQTAVFVGEPVALATGFFHGMVMEMTGIDSATVAQGTKLYVGTKGKPSMDGFNGVAAPAATAKVVGTVIGLDRLGVNRDTGAATGSHQEVMIRCNIA
jgi:hypothetical protein